jgi:RimJ/RimL family protein N-acetyltransferase
MVGHAGFHLPPGSDVLAQWAPGGVELGYTIFSTYRRRGFATEATLALVEFARGEGVPSVLATTNVENAPSRGVLSKCGFELVDQVQEDEVVEDIWLLRLTQPSSG